MLDPTLCKTTQLESIIAKARQMRFVQVVAISSTGEETVVEPCIEEAWGEAYADDFSCVEPEGARAETRPITLPPSFYVPLPAKE